MEQTVKEHYRQLEYERFDDLVNDAQHNGSFIFSFKDRIFFSDACDGWMFVEIVDYPFVGKETTGSFNSFDNMLEFRFFDGKTLEEAWSNYEVEFFDE